MKEGMLIGSGRYGDVYLLSNTKCEKIVSHCDKYTEFKNLLELQGIYGIPKVYNTTIYRNIRFIGEENKGLYNECKKRFVQRGKGMGIVMDYLGRHNLDMYKMIDSKQLIKCIFNAFYIANEIYLHTGLNHCDLHRRNVIIKKTTPFQKTYYIGKYKYILKNQIYKVYIIDFDAVAYKHEMNDINYLSEYFEHIFNFKSANTAELFFKNNFKQFLQ